MYYFNIIFNSLYLYYYYDIYDIVDIVDICIDSVELFVVDDSIDSVVVISIVLFIHYFIHSISFS